MEDIYALLNINKGILQDFHLQADRAVDHQTELAINRDMRTLKEIEERMMTDTTDDRRSHHEGNQKCKGE